MKLAQQFKKLKRLTPLIIFPYVILFLLAFYLGYERCKPTFIVGKIKYTRHLCGSIKGEEALPKPKDQSGKKVNAKVYTDSEANYWEIVDTNRTPPFPTGIKFYESGIGLPDATVIRWKNFLLGINREYYIKSSNAAFFGSNASVHYTLQSQIRTIRAYNVDTGETFDVPLDTPTWGEIWYVTSQVVDSTYYFGVGGAFGASLGYKLDLPPQRNSRITKLSSAIGNQINKYGNVYVSSFCYEGCSYSLFNPISLAVTPLKRMTDASNVRVFERKEELLGIDSLGRMIINVRIVPEDPQKAREDSKTEMIAAVPLSNENITIPLVKASELPEGVFKYFMIDGIDKILVLTKSTASIYDLTQHVFREIAIGAALQKSLSNKEFFYIYHPKTDTAVCFTDSGDSRTSSIDLVSEAYTEQVQEGCNTSSEEKKKEEIFSKLNLPDSFDFNYVPVMYKTYNFFQGVLESELPKGAEIIK